MTQIKHDCVQEIKDFDTHVGFAGDTIVFMDTYGERVRARRTELQMSQAELAKAIGAKNASTVGNIENREGESRFTFELADALGVTPSWLRFGTEPKFPPKTEAARPIRAWDDNDPVESDEVEVARLDLKLSAGSGRLQWEVDELGTRNRFRRSWCERKGFNPNKLATAMVEGDSMYATLVDGASVTINTADVAIKNGKVYALDYQGEFLVKRLFLQPDGSIRIVSDNLDKTRYPDINVGSEYREAVRILGKVVSQSADVD